MELCVGDNRCLENVYALRYQQTLARLRHAEVTPASDDVMADSDDVDDDDDDDDHDDDSMTMV